MINKIQCLSEISLQKVKDPQMEGGRYGIRLIKLRSGPHVLNPLPHSPSVLQ